MELHNFRNFFSLKNENIELNSRKNTSFILFYFHNIIPPGIPCHNQFSPGLEENLFFSLNHFYHTKNLFGAYFARENLNHFSFLTFLLYSVCDK